MDRSAQNSESLLLKLPKSMISFNDMSGNSFLIPVAVDNVVAPENSSQADSKPEKQDDNTQVPEPASVCQLQQPLLMRRSSSPALKTGVPYSESNVATVNVNLGQTEVLNSNQPLKPTVSNVLTSDHSNGSMNWPTSSADSFVGQPFQSAQIFTGSQNQATLQTDYVNQPNYPQSVPINQESSNIKYQNIFPPPPPVFSSSSTFPPHSAPSLNTFTEKSDYCAASSHEYYSQPPVITPSTAPAYYNNSGKSTSQIPPPPAYSSFPSSQSYNMLSSSMTSDIYNRVYEPVKPYWLFRDVVETKEIWCGFSTVDSERLEMAFQQDPLAIVPVDGGRYDAVLDERIKKPVYFEAKSLQIRRGTWFFRSESSQRFTPFPEEAASMLEQHYSTCVTSGQWQKRVNVPSIGCIVLENPQLLLYYKNEIELWPTLPDSKASPKTVRRGLPENFEILENENNHIDHLIFIVQGIGSFCDLRFRTVTECVDGFRDISNKLLSSHFKHEIENGRVGRVEFLPLAWHAKLHTNDKGFDRSMQNITLPSIPKLRHFTNDTLLDILLYSSPFYCQTIIDTVASELNKLYEIFLKRNPDFSGKVFVAGHSLGSLILFDILAHQQFKDVNTSLNSELNDKMSKLVEENKVDSEIIKDEFDSITSLLQACQLEEYADLFEKEKIDLATLTLLSNDDLKDLGLPTGPRKRLLNAVHSNQQVKNLPEDRNYASELLSCATSQGHSHPEKETQENFGDSKNLVFPFDISHCMQSIIYPRLQFEPACFFALGSPISMFLTVRGYDRISDEFRFPTCPNFFHIFHPYDPVAFRIERLIDPSFSAKPVLIPHHKGRKRMHLEIRENLSKVGFEIKQKVLETLRYTWNSLSGFAKAHTLPSGIEAEVDKLVSQQISETEFEQQAPSEASGEEIQIGSLNGGRRIDYVLQEKPIEALNDYIFALTSHATYWDSEDTVLMILREIYATDGIMVSSQSHVENKPLIYPEQSSFEAHSSHFDPCSFQCTTAEQVPSVSQFYSQNMPSAVPASSQTMQMSSNYNMPVPQISSNMPPPQLSSNMPPPPAAAATTTQQPVGPPPLSGFIKKSPFTR